MGEDFGQDLFDGDSFEPSGAEEAGENTPDFDFPEFSPSPSYSSPEPRRQRGQAWPPLILAAVGGLLLGGILTWLIMQLVYGGGPITKVDPPENTLEAYYRALEQQDFEAAVTHLDTTAPQVEKLETIVPIVNWVQQELFQSLSQFLGDSLKELLVDVVPDLPEEWWAKLEDMDTNLQLEFRNLVYTPVVVDREVAIIDAEFDVYVGFGEMLFPAGSVRRRHTLRWYQERWYVEP